MSSITSSRHMVWTVACAGLLGLGGILETYLAQAHSSTVEGLDKHPDASLVMPALMLAGAVACGAWPAFQTTWRALRRWQLAWQALIVAAIVGTFGLGHMFEAGTMALTFAVVLTFQTRPRDDAFSSAAVRSDPPGKH